MEKLTTPQIKLTDVKMDPSNGTESSLNHCAPPFVPKPVLPLEKNFCDNLVAKHSSTPQVKTLFGHCPSAYKRPVRKTATLNYKLDRKKQTNRLVKRMTSFSDFSLDNFCFSKEGVSATLKNLQPSTFLSFSNIMTKFCGERNDVLSRCTDHDIFPITCKVKENRDASDALVQLQFDLHFMTSKSNSGSQLVKLGGITLHYTKCKIQVQGTKAKVPIILNLVISPLMELTTQSSANSLELDTVKCVDCCLNIPPRSLPNISEVNSDTTRSIPVKSILPPQNSELDVIHDISTSPITQTKAVNVSDCEFFENPSPVIPSDSQPGPKSPEQYEYVESGNLQPPPKSSEPRKDDESGDLQSAPESPELCQDAESSHFQPVPKSSQSGKDVESDDLQPAPKSSDQCKDAESSESITECLAPNSHETCTSN